MAASRDCPFCRRTHTAEFDQDVDEMVMVCRAKAPPYFRGDLDAWEGEETIPIPVEREEIQRTREAEREVWIGTSSP